MTNSGSYHIFNESGIHIPFDEEQLVRVIHYIQNHESCHFVTVEVVFVKDQDILQINRTYLNHNDITDIITFPWHDESSLPEGTLYCCATQIQRQSEEYEVPFKTEILRIVIHGLLHLVGYDDQTEEQRRQMHILENKYITLYQGY